MNFTFAIITDWLHKERLFEIVNNIEHVAGLRNFQVLVVGGPRQVCEDEEILEFSFNKMYLEIIPAEDEWITTKKNTAAWLAKYNNIVFMHDYFLLDDYWWTGYEEFGDDWDICSNPQYLMNGKRHFTDWVTWDSSIYPRYTSLDYWNWNHTRNQYISGGYFLAKRKVLLEEPFNAAMRPGQPEDVEWSLRVRDKYKIRCNPYSIVRHNKIHRDCHD